MVLLKRLDYGLNGHQFPPIPRAPRSARRRGKSFWKKKSVNDDQMCAFDLLATVAGKLLSDGENSPKEHSSTVTEPTPKRFPEQEEEGPVRTVASDQGSCNSRFYGPEDTQKIPNCRNSPNGSSAGQNEDCCGFASAASSLCSEKIVNPEKLVRCKQEAESLSISCNYAKENGNLADVDVDEKPLGLVNVDNNNTRVLRREDDHVKLVVRDDDEDSFPCPQLDRRGIIKGCRPSMIQNGDSSIRKLLGSRCRKLHNPMRSDGNADSNEETMAIFHNMNNMCRRLRSQRDYPPKKRKVFSGLLADSDKEDGGFSNSPVNCLSGPGSDSPLQGGGASTWKTNNQNMPLKSRDSSYVRLSINSFKVPELCIEIPETETVGCLETTVLEALTAILGSGLKVGVFVQGKKVRDDSKTLLQTGISHKDCKQDALGFSLEPTSPLPAAANYFPYKNQQPFLLPPKPLSRYQNKDKVVPILTRLGSIVGSNHDTTPSRPPPDMLSSFDRSCGSSNNNKECKAMVPVVSASDVKALSVVPMRKLKRPEVAQRRIRRPFSVSEVEALVQAVEKLGTGRWRDVKLRAFDNAKHRTYVDLKDKWKTLVHTARISPQQRRGEPVPQELLDRVLVAHSYWSQYQPKQHVKHQQEEGSASCGLLLL